MLTPGAVGDLADGEPQAALLGVSPANSGAVHSPMAAPISGSRERLAAEIPGSGEQRILGQLVRSGRRSEQRGLRAGRTPRTRPDSGSSRRTTRSSSRAAARTVSSGGRACPAPSAVRRDPVRRSLRPRRHRLVGAQAVVVNHLQRRVGHGQPDPRERPPAAADDVEAAGRRPRRRARQTGEALVDPGRPRRVVLEQHARDRQGADRQAAIGAAGPSGVTTDRSTLPPPRSPTTPCGRMEAVGDTHGRGVGLVVAGQHGDRLAGGAARPRPGTRAPLSAPPHRLGRDILDLAGPQGLGDMGEAPQRMQRAVHLGPAEPAGRGQALAERAQRFLVEQRDRRPAQPLVDHEPDRVRADVDDARTGPADRPPRGVRPRSRGSPRAHAAWVSPGVGEMQAGGRPSSSRRCRGRTGSGLVMK